MEFSHVEKTEFIIKEMLRPLSTVEQAMFMNSLERISKHDGKGNDKQAIAVMFIDMLHQTHREELATIISVLVNKFMSPPYLKDREMLKRTLETIMGAVDMGEKLHEKFND